MPHELTTLPRPSVPLLAWYGLSWASEPEPAPKAPKDPDKQIRPRAAKIDPAEFGADQPIKQGTGLIVGRFMPPHLGHQFVIDFSRQFVDTLHIAIDARGSSVFTIQARETWLAEMCPTAKVFRLVASRTPDATPQILRQVAKVDYLFGSEPDGYDLAKKIGARFIAVDPQRRAVPISATQIREKPIANWAFIPPYVRPRFVLRVCLIGPESTGKTMLAQKLAEHYKTVAVPEFARTLTDAGRASFLPSDVQTIARAQLAAEAALARQANRVIFCDTGILQLMLWSWRLFGVAPKLVTGEAKNPRHDLCLLMDADVPFVGDSARNQPAERAAFVDQCAKAMEARKQPFVKISGSWENRFAAACDAVDKLIAKGVRQV